MATKAHLEGNKRHQDKLDRIVFYVEKGEKDKLKAHASSRGLSLNAYILELIYTDKTEQNTNSKERKIEGGKQRV